MKGKHYEAEVYCEKECQRTFVEQMSQERKLRSFSLDEKRALLRSSDSSKRRYSHAKRRACFKNGQG